MRPCKQGGTPGFEMAMKPDLGGTPQSPGQSILLGRSPKAGPAQTQGPRARGKTGQDSDSVERGAARREGPTDVNRWSDTLIPSGFEEAPVPKIAGRDERTSTVYFTSPACDKGVIRAGKPLLLRPGNPGKLQLFPPFWESGKNPSQFSHFSHFSFSHFRSCDYKE
jgi:hypothetical protein